MSQSHRWQGWKTPVDFISPTPSLFRKGKKGLRIGWLARDPIIWPQVIVVCPFFPEDGPRPGQPSGHALTLPVSGRQGNMSGRGSCLLMWEPESQLCWPQSHHQTKSLFIKLNWYKVENPEMIKASLEKIMWQHWLNLGKGTEVWRSNAEPTIPEILSAETVQTARWAPSQPGMGLAIISSYAKQFLKIPEIRKHISMCKSLPFPLLRPGYWRPGP